MININYQKRKNQELFKTLENKKLTFLSSTQNYIPIYNRFFSLNETNYNNINLNNKWYLSNVREEIDVNTNIFKCTLRNIDNDKTKIKNVFFKYAPLLDPFKYLVGKYSLDDINMPSLLTLENEINTKEKIDIKNKKMNDPNNSSYIDGLFVYLTSQMFYKHNFVHGLDFYGCFNGIKNNYKINIADDVDYLTQSDFFIKNKEKLFKIDNDYNFLFEEEEVKKLKPIKIGKNITSSTILSANSVNDDLFEDIFTLDDLKEMSMSIDLVDITHSDYLSSKMDNKSTTLKSGSSCSSRTSHTTNYSEDNIEKLNIEDVTLDTDNQSKNSGENSENSGENSEKSEWEDEDSENSEEDEIIATIPKFPVHLICMEHCDNTFDDLILSNELSEEEWMSALMQVIMILITYQKCFSFTHNDLHTNNIMYNETDKEFLYYCYKKKYYKVPTFGRIYKIIDFGRAIYKFNGKIFCSDSFQPGDDAATQYNTEPYFNDKKPRLEPNFSFDLCRLACSIFDYVVDDLESIKDLSKLKPYIRIIVEWCLDDKNINILYKNTGEDRYLDFKLYKMIARCVHNHTPQAQLDRPEFSVFSVVKNNNEVFEKTINIDELPVYC